MNNARIVRVRNYSLARRPLIRLRFELAHLRVILRAAHVTEPASRVCSGGTRFWALAHLWVEALFNRANRLAHVSALCVGFLH